MDSSAPTPDFALRELAETRERTLEALERLGAHPGGSRAIADAMVALQEAANKLGQAEVELAELMPRNAPAPVLGPDEAQAAGATPWNGEACAVMALAEFSVPYAAGPAEQAECWLRALRREGSVGRALGDLGFPEGELSELAQPVRGSRDLESLHAVAAKAALLARHRGAREVTTTDLLFAVLGKYGGLADRALYARGIGREDLLSLLADGATGGVTLRR